MTEVYRDWINSLADGAARARLQARVDRLVHGTRGRHRNFSGGVSELEIDFGLGDGVCYSERGSDLIVLLAGGNPSTQEQCHPGGHRARQHPTPHDVAKQLHTPEETVAHLDAWLAKTPDVAADIARAPGDIARASGMSQVDRKAGLSWKSLHKALGENGNPRRRVSLDLRPHGGTKAMPFLFSYGTLRSKEVQLSLFGRELKGHPDQLIGFNRSLVRIQDPEFARTSGSAHHAILRPTGNRENRVDGTVFEVSDEELSHADLYEPAEYKRVVAELASGGVAWVYVDATLTT